MIRDALAGIRIHQYKYQKDCYKRDYRRLDSAVIVEVERKLADLLKWPRPEDLIVRDSEIFPGRVWTIDVPPAHRISFHKMAVYSPDVKIGGHEPIPQETVTVAVLRRVLRHDRIDQ